MPNSSETLATIDSTILDVMDHAGLADSLSFGSIEGVRGYFNEAGTIEGEGENTVVFDVPSFNLRASDWQLLADSGIELEDEIEIDGRGTFRYVGGPHSAGIGRVLILLGQTDGG